MKLYPVTKEGVYRHEIIGIFSGVGLAISCADESLKLEPDDWHSFEVREFEIDKSDENDGEFIYLARKERKMEEIPYEMIRINNEN